MNRPRTGRSDVGLNGPGKTRAKRSWASLIAGLACALGGMIGFAYLLVGPSYRQSGVLATGQRLPDQTWGLIHEGIEGLVLVQLLALAVEITGVAVGAYSHFRGNRSGAPVLWSCTFLLSVQASVSFLGVGWLIGPSALLAIVSSVTAPPRMKRLS